MKDSTMEKINRAASYVLVAVVAVAATLFATRYGDTRETSKLDLVEQMVKERYIAIEDVDMDAAEDAAAAAMVSALGDRWSHYFDAETYASIEENMNNAYVGVGITITQEENGLRILEVQSGGPAQEAGLQAEDLITEIDDQSVAGMTTTQAKNLVRGEAGTQVRMSILREGRTLEFTLTRAEMKTVVASGKMLNETVGLVTIENFDSRCAEETIAAIEDLMGQGAERLIFDVRNNPGGYASELVKVLDYLLPEGDLFRTVDYKGNERVDTSDANCLNVPMAVLVNGDSYSAAEFFAAALQEYEAATVVGSQTCGKGYFQNTFKLSDGSALSLSVGKYFTPKGKNLAGVGITPDIVVDVDEETGAKIAANQIPPEDDPQLQAALEEIMK